MFLFGTISGPEERTVAEIAYAQDKAEFSRRAIDGSFESGEVDFGLEGFLLIEADIEPQPRAASAACPPYAYQKYAALCLVSGCYAVRGNGSRFCDHHQPKPCADPQMMAGRARPRRTVRS
jgi:hypothetical protein